MRKAHWIVSATAGLTLLTCGAFSQAGLMAIWDFGASSAYYTEQATYNTATAPVLTLAGGDIDTNGKNGVDYTDVTGVLHAAGQAAAWDDINKSGTDNDAVLTIKLDTTGFSKITLRWDYKADTAPSFDLDYRLNAADDWTEILNNETILGDAAWHSITVDLSALIAINNQSYVEFRLNDLDRDPGNNKYVFDNLEIVGVPEPTTITLLGLGMTALLRKKK